MTSAPRRLVGDVGGTSARLALLDEHGVPEEPTVLRVDDFPHIVAALQHFIARRGNVSVEAAAIAVNGPVIGDRIMLSNSHWSFSVEQVRDTLGFGRLQIINDFTALALSVPKLPPEQLDPVGRGGAIANHAIAVIGPGTGLGVSGLVPCGAQWTALQGEGGHITLGGSSVRDRAVHSHLTTRFDHVSAERFLSGPGLVNIDGALRAIDGLPDVELLPSDITRLGLANEDPVCRETLELFCRLLGKVAGNLVLTLGAEGGCFIGGGVVPRLGRFFHESDFRAHFEAKGRMTPYLERVPTLVIHAPFPALIGAAGLLD